MLYSTYGLFWLIVQHRLIQRTSLSNSFSRNNNQYIRYTTVKTNKMDPNTTTAPPAAANENGAAAAVVDTAASAKRPAEDQNGGGPESKKVTTTTAATTAAAQQKSQLRRRISYKHNFKVCIVVLLIVYVDETSFFCPIFSVRICFLISIPPYISPFLSKLNFKLLLLVDDKLTLLRNRFRYKRKEKRTHAK